MLRRNLVGLLLILATGGLLVWAFDAAAEQESADAEMFEEYDRFIEIVRLVQKQYVRDVDTPKLFEDAIKGMLGGLDPFSNYIPPEQLDEFNKATRGRFGGIGIQIGMRKGLLTVISPLEGTPAYQAGILAGDVIVEIEGKSTDGLTLNDAVKVLTGDPETKVTMTVRHMTGETKEVTITRAIIEVKTVKGFNRDEDGHWIWMIDPEKKIGYVRVTGFVDNTVDDLKLALDELRAEDMKALILDLRFNPGGQLKSAIEMVDLFVKKGIVVQTKGRTTPYWEATATEAGTLPVFPMVVMINPFSASASEIVSGALQDHNRAIVVGERSFGKGSVQNVIPLEGDESALKLTTSKYYMPSGRNIHREEDMTDEEEWGVVPDIVVPMEPEDYVAIIRARQAADVIHGNGDSDEEGGGAAPDGDGTIDEDAPEGSPGPAEPEGTEGEDPTEAEAPAPDSKTVDRQLERALEILRTLEVIEKYLSGSQAA